MFLPTDNLPANNSSLLSITIIRQRSYPLIFLPPYIDMPVQLTRNTTEAVLVVACSWRVICTICQTVCVTSSSEQCRAIFDVLTAVLLRIKTCVYVTLGDEETICRNVGNHLPRHSVVYWIKALFCPRFSCNNMHCSHNILNLLSHMG